MSDPSNPAPYRMESLDKKKAQAVSRNLMAPGVGTPWEDRGAQGRVGAFFKTLMMSLFQPVKLTEQMRRPELSSDVKFFTIGCGIFWGLCIVVNAWLNLGPIQTAKLYDDKHPIPAQSYGASDTDPRFSVDAQWYWGATAIIAVLDTGVAFGALKLASAMFEKLISHDMPQRAPSVLYFNLMGYSLGPSILAPIPLYGWMAALAWIFLNWLIVARSRLGAKMAASIIAVVLTAVVVGLLVFGVNLVEQLAIQHFSVTDQRPT